MSEALRDGALNTLRNKIAPMQNTEQLQYESAGIDSLDDERLHIPPTDVYVSDFGVEMHIHFSGPKRYLRIAMRRSSGKVTVRAN